MDVCLKNKYIDGKAQTRNSHYSTYFQYIPSIYLVINYNMYLYNMA